MPGHRVAWTAGVVVTTVSSLLAAITLAGGDVLGISVTGMAWIGVLAAVLGTLRGFLPEIQRFPTNGSGPTRGTPP
jgi:hypothetical protein